MHCGKSATCCCGLLECKTFKEASLAFSVMMEAAERSVPRRAGLEEPFISLAPDPLEGVKAQQLRDALVRLLSPEPPVRVNTDHIAPVRASVADTLEDLLGILPKEQETTFTRLTTGLGERLEVIVYFLALLELYKRGTVDLQQRSKLAELHVKWLGDDESEPSTTVGARAGAPAAEAPRADEYQG